MSLNVEKLKETDVVTGETLQNFLDKLLANDRSMVQDPTCIEPEKYYIDVENEAKKIDSDVSEGGILVKTEDGFKSYGNYPENLVVKGNPTLLPSLVYKSGEIPIPEEFRYIRLAEDENYYTVTGEKQVTHDSYINIRFNGIIKKYVSGADKSRYYLLLRVNNPEYDPGDDDERYKHVLLADLGCMPFDDIPVSVNVNLDITDLIPEATIGLDRAENYVAERKDVITLHDIIFVGTDSSPGGPSSAQFTRLFVYTPIVISKGVAN